MRSRDRMVGCAGPCQQQTQARTQARGFWLLKDRFTGPVQNPVPSRNMEDANGRIRGSEVTVFTIQICSRSALIGPLLGTSVSDQGFPEQLQQQWRLLYKKEKRGVTPTWRQLVTVRGGPNYSSTQGRARCSSEAV